MAKHQDKAMGQALIELALLLPLLLLIIANVVNFGGMFYAAITVANAARHGSQYLVLSGASIGAPGSPAPAIIFDLLAADTITLANPASLKLRVCREDKADWSAPLCTSSPAGFSPAQPPEETERAETFLYAQGWVDVEYEYLPLIPLFTVPVLGIPLSPPPQIIHRQSVMRMLQ